MHEVLLTGEIIKLPLWPTVRGKNVGPLLPDATTYIDGCPVHWELDRATEGYKAVRSRMQVYLPQREPVIWCAPTEARMEGIWKHCRPLKDRGFFKVIGSDEVYDWQGNAYVFPAP